MDVTTDVVQAINGWLMALATTVTRPALQAASPFIFQTPDFTLLPDVRRLWAVTVGVADATFVLAAMGVGIMVMASGTFETLYSTKRLLPRLVVAIVLTNMSLALCGALIGLDNALVTGLLGTNPANDIWAHLLTHITTGNTGEDVLSSLVSLALAAIALLLVVAYLIRDFILLAGIVLGPLALATYALPQIDDVARTWGRLYVVAVLVQAAQAELLNVGVQLIENTDWLGGPASALVTALVLIIVLYVDVRLPFWAYRWAMDRSVSSYHAIQVLAATGRSILEAFG
jgi:hypothetical protein